jgi:tryptophanyl-tRNA synthetase
VAVGEGSKPLGRVPAQGYPEVVTVAGETEARPVPRSGGRERVFSGMRPTGRLHIGHWFGALQNWVKLQDTYDCIYCVVDLHALTTGFADVSRIHEDGIEMLADWIGAGVDPERSIVFRQSEVPEHAELALLLGMVTPKSWLERVPTYKGQIAELGEEIDTYGFLGYPLLQTADIILYRATKVPVGKDQLPHLELAREIVRRFNHLYGQGDAGEVFPEPQPVLTEAPVLLGIDNRKMSKSYGNAIELGAEPDTVREMVGRMITDPQTMRKGDPGRPEICNVFSYDKLFDTPPERIVEIDRTCRSGELGCVEHKQEIAERIVDYLRPFRERRQEALADRGELERILARGAERARVIATDVMERARRAMGL